MNVVLDRVEELLSDYSVLRSNDRMLIEVYLDVYHEIDTFREYCRDPEAPALSTIVRSRRKIQGEGRWLADEVVKKARSVKEEEHRTFFRKRRLF